MPDLPAPVPPASVAGLARVTTFFESLSVQSLPHLADIYSPGAFFKDPFNDVQGLPAIRTIFSHMFVQVTDPRFVVTTHMAQGQEAFLTWEFLFRMKRFSREVQCIRGATHFRFDADGLVTLHRDYWDAAEELYEKLPLLGSVMRALKRAAQR